MCAKHYENPTMLSKVTAENVGDVFFETHCTIVKTPLYDAPLIVMLVDKNYTCVFSLLLFLLQ